MNFCKEGKRLIDLIYNVPEEEAQKLEKKLEKHIEKCPVCNWFVSE